jgi:hypothetical protein
MSIYTKTLPAPCAKIGQLITKSPRLAAIYLAEFMRLYEHYRARAIAQDATPIAGLAPSSAWAKEAYTADTPEYKGRIRMAS